jgi:hypothetical protein
VAYQNAISRSFTSVSVDNWPFCHQTNFHYFLVSAFTTDSRISVHFDLQSVTIENWKNTEGQMGQPPQPQPLRTAI